MENHEDLHPEMTFNKKDRSCSFAKRYREAIRLELNVLQGFIINGHSLNNMGYADVTVLAAVTERKLEELL